MEVLQRDRRQREEYHLREFQAHLITVDEYREATGRDPLGGRAGQLVRPLNLVPLDELPERAKVIPIRAHALPAVVEKALGRAPGIPRVSRPFFRSLSSQRHPRLYSR